MTSKVCATCSMACGKVMGPVVGTGGGGSGSRPVPGHHRTVGAEGTRGITRPVGIRVPIRRGGCGPPGRGSTVGPTRRRCAVFVGPDGRTGHRGAIAVTLLQTVGM